MINTHLIIIYIKQNILPFNHKNSGVPKAHMHV